MRAPAVVRTLLLAVVLAASAGGAHAQTAVTAPPTQAAPAAGGAPFVVWVAVGVCGFAVLMSGAAVGLALWARSRAAAAAERRGVAGPDPRLTERLDRLEAQVRALTTAARADLGSAPARPAAAPFPPGAKALSTDAAASPPAPAPSTAAPPPPPEPRAAAEGLLAWSQGVRDDFARLARDPASAAPDFLARHQPRGAVLGPEGASLIDGFEGAKLWAVRAPGEAEVWALTPGEAAVLNWSAHFAPQRAEVATEVFGPAFDLLPDGEGALRLEEPALVRRDAAGRLSVRRRGRLSGFRS